MGLPVWDSTYMDMNRVTLSVYMSWSMLAAWYSIVFFKRLGIQHIHKEIKLQGGMNGIDYILCKMDLNPIRRMAYKCNTLNDVHIETHFKSPYIPLWYSQFQ